MEVSEKILLLYALVSHKYPDHESQRTPDERLGTNGLREPSH